VKAVSSPLRTLLAALALAGAAAAQSSPFGAFARELAGHPPPPWLAEGIRLTYETGFSAVRPGEEAPAGSAGGGFLQVDVVAVTPGDVALALRIFAPAGASGALVMIGEQALTGLPAWGADLWVSPDALRKIAGSLPDGGPVSVSRGSHDWNGKKVAAIRFQTGGGPADLVRSTQVYDEETGLCLLQMSADRRTPGEDWQGRSVQSLVSFRHRELPWGLGRPPAWIFTIAEYRYDGEVVTQVPGAWPMRMPVTMLQQVVDRGANWVRFREVLHMQGAGAAPPEAVRVSGPTQVGGLWLSPPGLAGLRSGQVLDTDPVTKVQLKVEAIGRTEYGREVVRLREEGPAHALVYDYELATGMLLATQAYSAPLHMQIQMRFVGKRK
jgi:hypothetical protein